MPITFTMPSLARTVEILGIKDSSRFVPRQVRIEPLDVPKGSVVIYATATGIVYDAEHQSVTVVVTGGVRMVGLDIKPLMCFQLKGFDGTMLVWQAVFHDRSTASFDARLTFGPAIGFAQ